MVKYNLNPRSGSLKDNDLFRRFFVCMNYETRSNNGEKKDPYYSRNESKRNQTGLYIQYGIVDGFDSNEIVHLSYFDENPIELRYYMFGR